uniref:MBG domain-containing protein n=1 Tax=Adlercreutzia sp. ZJ141 TaxID=2709406 RepID=UPI00273894AC
GSITVNPATLTVTTPSESKVYDGTALTAKGTITGFVNGETATFTTTGTRTAVGSSENTYSLVWDGTAKQTNYTINESIGTLTVTENADEIVVTTTGGEYTYDGQAHGATVEVSGLPTGYTLDTATSNDTATDVTTEAVAANCDTLIIKNAAGEDVTSELNIKRVDGSITVNPATLTVTTPDANKTYDGTALTAAGKVEGFVNNETATFTTTGTQTDVGSSDNTYSIEWNGSAKASNYTISDTIGTLSVTENTDEITVTTTGGTFTYDGQAHGATVSVSGLPTGYTLETATSSAAATNVEDGTVVATCDTLVIKNAAGQDVTAKLNIKKVNGSITVNPATLTVTTPSESKVYDGTALTAKGTITGFVNGETATFTTTGTRTAVGSSENTYSLVWDGTAKQTNYTINESIGTLTVTENADEIVVTTTGGEYTYDGQAHGATVEVSGLPTGYTLDTATSNDTATDVTTEAVAANCDTLIIKNAAGEDVTSELNIKRVDGSITVNPATLTVTTPDANKTYDGTALTAAGKVEGFVNNETATFTTTGTQTDVGSSDNTYSIEWNGSAKASNYTISDTIGTLSVTENTDEITVTTTGGTFTYDGQAHGATVSVSGLPTGYTLETATSSAAATNVEDGTVVATCDTLVIKNAANEDVASKLNISYVNGSITVNPRPVVITVNNKSKMFGNADPAFDGSISAAEVDAQGNVTNDEGLVAKDMNSFGSVVYSRIDADVNVNVGTYEDTLTAVVENLNNNYTYTVVPGDFTITDSNANAVTIDVNAEGMNKVYDGQPSQIVATAAVEGSILLYATSADGPWSETNPSYTDAGQYTVYVKAQAPNFAETVPVSATISIAPAPVTITVNNASKVEGADDPVFTGRVEGLAADGDLGVVNYVRSNDDEAVGIYPDALTATYLANSNYDITVILGDFTITAAPVPPTPPTPTVPPNPTPTPTPTPGVVPDGPLAPVITPIVGALEGVAETVIGDDATPLAQSGIEDAATPLAAAEHVSCWVHFYIILGIIVTALFSVCVAIRRALFSRRLKKYEDNLTGGDDPAPETSSHVGGGADPLFRKGVPAMAAAGSNE